MSPPIYGHGRSPEPDGREGLEIPPKVPPIGGVFWSTHISIMIFPTKLLVLPPLNHKGCKRANLTLGRQLFRFAVL